MNRKITHAGVTTEITFERSINEVGLPHYRIASGVARGGTGAMAPPNLC